MPVKGTSRNLKWRLYTHTIAIHPTFLVLLCPFFFFVSANHCNHPSSECYSPNVRILCIGNWDKSRWIQITCIFVCFIILQINYLKLPSTNDPSNKNVLPEDSIASPWSLNLILSLPKYLVLQHAWTIGTLRPDFWCTKYGYAVVTGSRCGRCSEKINFCLWKYFPLDTRPLNTIK